MGCGVRRRRRELRWPLLACRAESSVPASLSQGLTIPRCLTIPGWAEWQSEGPQVCAPGGEVPGRHCRPAGPSHQYQPV